MKLGKLDPTPSPFGEFKTYFKEALPAPPTEAHYGHRVSEPWRMYGNGPDPDVTIIPGFEGAGDCVEAGKAHALLTANYDEYGHTVPVPTANAVIENYCAYQGCTPAQLAADPSRYDNGENMTDSLTGWTRTAQFGTKLAFTAPVNHGSVPDLKNAIYLTGGLAIGIQLPGNVEQEFPNEWTWDPNAPIVGGHCVWLTGYTADYVALCTWGQLIQCTWQFLMNTIDEAHALVLPQAIAAGKGPTGLQIASWESDLRNLG